MTEKWEGTFGVLQKKIGEYNAQQDQIQSLQEQNESKRQQFKEQEKQTAEDKVNIESLTKQVKALEQQLASAEAEKEKLEEQWMTTQEEVRCRRFIFNVKKMLTITSIINDTKMGFVWGYIIERFYSPLEFSVKIEIGYGQTYSPLQRSYLKRCRNENILLYRRIVVIFLLTSYQSRIKTWLKFSKKAKLLLLLSSFFCSYSVPHASVDFFCCFKLSNCEVRLSQINASKEAAMLRNDRYKTKIEAFHRTK